MDKPLVLVAEDFADVRDLYVECMTAAGFRVAIAVDGSDAVTKALAEPPQAIIIDLQMPGTDGWEATRRIRAALGAGPYIVAVSAHDSDGARADAYDAGCDDFVAKPMDPRVLCTIVSAALRARS